MEIRVIDIISTNPECIALCKTQYGIVKLIWRDDIPSIHKSYNVEFDINAPLIWGKDIKSTDYNDPLFSNNGSKIVISGILESVDDDGYVVMRMGDSILAFETQGNAFQVGTMIEIEVNSLEAYPIIYW